jgi:hypothetical protein
MNVITRVSVLSLLLIAAVCAAPAQSTAAPAVVAPTNFAACGAAFNGEAGNGWCSYGKSLGAGFFSFTTYDVSVASKKPLTFQSSTRTGEAFDITTIVPSLSFGGRLHIVEIVDAGQATTAQATGFAFSGGGYGAYDLGPKFKNLNIIAGARALKTTNGTGVILEVGIGHTF